MPLEDALFVRFGNKRAASELKSGGALQKQEDRHHIENKNVRPDQSVQESGAKFIAKQLISMEAKIYAMPRAESNHRRRHKVS